MEHPGSRLARFGRWIAAQANVDLVKYGVLLAAAATALFLPTFARLTRALAQPSGGALVIYSAAVLLPPMSAVAGAVLGWLKGRPLGKQPGVAAFLGALAFAASTVVVTVGWYAVLLILAVES